MKRFFVFAALLAVSSCAVPGNEPDKHSDGPLFDLSPSSIARMFASLPMEPAHLREVYDAVALSSGNGYDEEYTLDRLVCKPGAGLGPVTKSGAYERPLRELVRDYLSGVPLVRSGVEDAMTLLAESGYQLYWPYADDWDGETYPVITFDPGYGAESNYGYALAPGPDGAVIVDTLEVTEAMAMVRPVWVVNSNNDSAFTPLELFVREKQNNAVPAAARPRKLMLKSFKMLRNYDSWFGGASEFFVKCGFVDGFNASTDAELKLYTPSVTDFMIVVKRRYVDKELPYEAILVTDFTNQLDKLAFLIVEDDGGTRTNWKCEVAVKIQSKSYGINIDIPYNEKDDIVWRGQLSARFFEEQDVVTGRFGDVVCSFELD